MKDSACCSGVASDKAHSIYAPEPTATTVMAIPIPIFSLIVMERTQGTRMWFTSGRERDTVSVLMSMKAFGNNAFASIESVVLTESVLLSLYDNIAYP